MASQFCVRVGNNIKKYRKEAGITLKELGEKIGVAEATAQKYEAGNIKKNISGGKTNEKGVDFINHVHGSINRMRRKTIRCKPRNV